MPPHHSLASQSLITYRCIFQDDLRDWAAEASRMRDVYSKAEFCVAATAAKSGDVGLFFDRDIEQLTLVMVEATWSRRHDLSPWPSPGLYLFGFHQIAPLTAIDSAPLNQRAWVAQERFLSPRILHFTQSLLFWECHMSFTNENGQVLDSGYFTSKINQLRESLNDAQRPESNLGSIQNIALRTTSNDTKPTTSRKIYVAWGEFLTHYTSCGITNESDILVALVGIADEVGHAINDCLIAGLWKTQFIKELCWKALSGHSMPSMWRAPSWSWASLSGMIIPHDWRYVSTPHEMAAIIEFHISTKPSGEVEQGSVLVKCRLVPGTIHYRRPSRWDITYNACGTLDERILTPSSEETDPSDGRLIKIQLDIMDASCYHADQAVDVQLLVLLRSDSLRGICIKNSVNRAGAFERVGYFYAADVAADSVLAAYYQARVQEILLV